jgi:hypothetical protein
VEGRSELAMMVYVDSPHVTSCLASPLVLVMYVCTAHT